MVEDDITVCGGQKYWVLDMWSLKAPPIRRICPDHAMFPADYHSLIVELQDEPVEEVDPVRGEDAEPEELERLDEDVVADVDVE